MTKRDSEPVASPQATSEKCGKVIWYQSAPHVCVLPKEHEGRCNDAAAQPPAGTTPQRELPRAEDSRSAQRKYAFQGEGTTPQAERSATKRVIVVGGNSKMTEALKAALKGKEVIPVAFSQDEARAVAPVETPDGD